MAANGFIAKHFAAQGAGYVTGINDQAVIKPVPQLDENISLARFANLLHQISGDPQPRAVAEYAMRYLATPAVALRRITEAGILLADRELNADPLHLTVVGGKADAQARALFAATLEEPGWYKRAEWWDLAEGPLPNPDVTYPQMDRAAVFVCTEDRCSLPMYTPQALKQFIAAQADAVP